MKKYNKELHKLVSIAKTKKNLSEFSKKYKKDIEKYTSFLYTNNLRERLYYIENNLTSPVKCDNCNNIPTWDWRNLKYKEYCPKCIYSSKEFSKKRIKTNIIKFGVENPFQSEEVKNRIRKTNLKRHGVEHALQSEKIQEKYKQTCIERHGGIGFGSKTLSKKSKQTNIKRYGVKNPFQSKKVKDRIKQTNIKRYGVENPRQSKIIQEKSKKTLSKNYHKRFLKISNKIHKNRYKYFELKESHDLIDIECLEHGIFQLPMYYHMNGFECPKCSKRGFSQMAIDWLNHIAKTKDIYIQHAMNDGEYRISGTRYKADGYCKETKTIYEFLGDFWHGNPELFKSDEVNIKLDKTYGECYENTMKRLEEIKSLGYNIEYIWENDWNNS